MKLSDAIKLGAMLKPQAFEGDAPAGSCALRAAAEAVGLRRSDDGVPYAPLRHRWPILYREFECPACDDCFHDELIAVIYMLNDVHRWTREQIADYVATIEAQHEVEPAPALVAVDVA